MMAGHWISGSASIGEGTEIGRGVVVEDGVVIGRRCRIGHHAVIREGSVIGDDVRVDDHVVLGKEPLRALNSVLKPASKLDPVSVGDRCLIGTGAVIYRGAILGSDVLAADQATVRERVSIGSFTIVGRGVVVENDTAVGRYCKLETGCYITAYSLLEDRVFIAPNVSSSNDAFLGRTEERLRRFRGVTVRRGGRIGVGAVILPGLTIGADGVVAAGSLLTKDVPARQIFLGNPARYLRDVPEEQLLENQGWPE